MMANSKTNQLMLILTVLVFVVFIAAGYKYKASTTEGAVLVAELDKSCDLRVSACHSKLPNGGEVTFSLSPNDIPLLKPLVLTVGVTGVEVSRVAVDLVGMNMEMGLNRTLLSKVQNGRFKGEGVLPVCTNAKMIWEARVMLETAEGMMVAPFEFYTTR